MPATSEVGEKSTINKMSTSIIEKPKEYSKIRVNWDIGNFSQAYVKKCEPSTFTDSRPFEIMHGKNKTKWALRIYPNGNDETTSNWFGICLVKQAEVSQHYSYSCRFSIIKGGKVILTKEFPRRNRIIF